LEGRVPSYTQKCDFGAPWNFRRAENGLLEAVFFDEKVDLSASGCLFGRSRYFLRAPGFMEIQVPRRGPLLDRLLWFPGTILDANPPKHWSDFRYKSYDSS